MKCQSGTSKIQEPEKKDGRGGRRTLPYVFTEQGISMLASVLHSEVAINVSIGIMRAFVEMRRFIANNALLFERISNVELKQLEYQKQTDEKLDQIFDAFSLIVSLIQKAEKEIVLIDERLSTVEAENMLIKDDVKRKKRKNVIDELSAAIILDTYLRKVG